MSNSLLPTGSTTVPSRNDPCGWTNTSTPRRTPAADRNFPTPWYSTTAAVCIGSVMSSCSNVPSISSSRGSGSVSVVSAMVISYVWLYGWGGAM